MSRLIARLAINRVHHTASFQCLHNRIHHRTFSGAASSSDPISSPIDQSIINSETIVENEPVKKVRVRRSVKPKVQPFNASVQAKSTEQPADQSEITDQTSVPPAPKRTRGRPRKQPLDDQTLAATENVEDQPSVTPVKHSVIPRRRIIRKPAPFTHSARAPFGVQDVLSLLYTYLPGPHTAAQSSLPHPVQIYDVHSRSIFNNFIVTVFCTSARQMSYLAQAVYKLARARDACPLNKSVLSLERHKATDWQMVDMGPIMLHVFNVNAVITQPSLDYHPSLPEPVLQHHRRSNRDAEYEERELQIPQPEREAVVLQRHPVVDAIERQFSDCVVPVERHLSLTDYTNQLTDEDGEQRVVEIQ